jgi:hypothetical protein
LITIQRYGVLDHSFFMFGTFPLDQWKELHDHVKLGDGCAVSHKKRVQDEEICPTNCYGHQAMGHQPLHGQC